MTKLLTLTRVFTLIIIEIFCVNALSSVQLWSYANVTKAELISGAYGDLEVATISAMSFIGCASYASSISWPRILCTEGSGSVSCHLFGSGTPEISQVFEASQQTSCYAMFDCRRATGEKDIEGTALQDQFCPDITDRCTRVGYQPYLPIQLTSSCPVPFSYTAKGLCLHINSTKSSFCISREYCRNLGGDLVSPETYEQLIEMAAFAEDVTLNMVWLGLQRYGSVFYWLHQRTSYDESWPIEFGRDLSADFHARLYYDPPRIYDTTQHHVFHPFCQIWH